MNYKKGLRLGILTLVGVLMLFATVYSALSAPGETELIPHKTNESPDPDTITVLERINLTEYLDNLRGNSTVTAYNIDILSFENGKGSQEGYTVNGSFLIYNPKTKEQFIGGANSSITVPNGYYYVYGCWNSREYYSIRQVSIINENTSFPLDCLKIGKPYYRSTIEKGGLHLTIWVENGTWMYPEIMVDYTGCFEEGCRIFKTEIEKRDVLLLGGNEIRVVFEIPENTSALALYLGDRIKNLNQSFSAYSEYNYSLGEREDYGFKNVAWPIWTKQEDIVRTTPQVKTSTMVLWNLSLIMGSLTFMAVVILVILFFKKGGSNGANTEVNQETGQ